jgi:hypothetical protein
MEDTIVKPGLIAYQFRVDLCIETGLTQVMEFMEKYEVQYYICGAEISSLGKHHFQCILWFNKVQNTTKLRNWWKGRADTTNQPVAVTSAKKIKNLAKYTMKEGNFTTNLTKEEIIKIGKWKKKLQDSQWSEQLDKECIRYGKCKAEQLYADYPEGYEENKTDYLEGFIVNMLVFYKSNYKRPMRNTLQHLAWKHGYITNYYLYKQWFTLF